VYFKSFSLLERLCSLYILSIAYDLVPKLLVNESIAKALAFNLNGKKKKLKYQYFYLPWQMWFKPKVFR
jgi:hypothetical protein